MKKVLLYVATAILLGTVTMVVPLGLLKPSYYNLITFGGRAKVAPGSLAFYETLNGGEETFKQGALKTAVSPSNLRSTGLMLIPSFLLALCVSLYLKKRIF
jgi:hypothetical protein